MLHKLTGQASNITIANMQLESGRMYRKERELLDHRYSCKNSDEARKFFASMTHTFVYIVEHVPDRVHLGILCASGLRLYILCRHDLQGVKLEKTLVLKGQHAQHHLSDWSCMKLLYAESR